MCASTEKVQEDVPLDQQVEDEVPVEKLWNFIICANTGKASNKNQNSAFNFDVAKI